jgi:hypothetical protein
MEIFVFGSNLAGRQGAGSALEARRNWGAVYGVGSGPTGRSYAIPTKDYDLVSLPLEAIAAGVAKFMEYAAAHPHDSFYVVKIGCGLAGYKEEDIAPMFFAAPANCVLPEGWREVK